MPEGVSGAWVEVGAVAVASSGDSEGVEAQGCGALPWFEQ